MGALQLRHLHPSGVVAILLQRSFLAMGVCVKVLAYSPAQASQSVLLFVVWHTNNFSPPLKNIREPNRGLWQHPAL